MKEYNDIIKEVESKLNFKCTREELEEIYFTATISMIAGLDVPTVVHDAVTILGMQKKYGQLPTWYAFLYVN